MLDKKHHGVSELKRHEEVKSELNNEKNPHPLLSQVSPLQVQMVLSREHNGALLASFLVNPGMTVTFPGKRSLAKAGIWLYWHVPYLFQHDSTPSTWEKK